MFGATSTRSNGGQTSITCAERSHYNCAHANRLCKSAALAQWSRVCVSNNCYFSIRGQPSSPGPVTILSFSPVGACAHKHGSLMRATCAVWSEMAMIHDTGGWGVPRKYRALVCGVVANTRDDTLSTQTHVSLTKPDLPRNQRARISPAGERCSTKRRGTLDRTFRDTTAIITLRSI